MQEDGTAQWENPGVGLVDSNPDQPSAASRAVAELEDGLEFWGGRRDWGEDLGNADYKASLEENPHRVFTLEWWKPFLERLNRWKATRGWDNGTILTSRFVDCAAELGVVWTKSCEPFLGEDITSVTWEHVSAFPTLAATIKPTRSNSPVFTSKFCHFLAPRIFPVVDNTALGNRWPTYEMYFRYVQDEWASTETIDRTTMITRVTERIEATGAAVFPGFPLVNKIVELRLIGRHHPR